MTRGSSRAATAARRTSEPAWSSRRVTDDIGFDPAAIQLAPISPDCVGDVGGFALRAPAAQRTTEPQSDFQDAADSGYFEQVGAKILS